MAISLGTIEEFETFISGDLDNLLKSYVEVTSKDLFRKKLPIQQGSYDAHMGTTENNWRCQSCYNTKTDCPGHFGHINLKYPVQSHMYKDEIMQWLKVICFKCGSLLINKVSHLKQYTRSKKLGMSYIF